MTRANPTLAVPDLARRTDTPMIHVRSYRMIAPLFGGGVEPQQADPVSVVRPSEVRGQLRFWWRATRAGRYGPDGRAEMKADEDRLWGSTEGQSRVEVEVRNADGGVEIRTYKDQMGRPRGLGDPSSPLSYGAFPLRNVEARPGERPREPGSLRFGVTFNVAVTLPTDAAQRTDVLAALWAWETFGGLGARTRRGFGALQCLKVSGASDAGPWLPPSADATAVGIWLRERFEQFVIAGPGPEGVPLLASGAPLAVGRNQQIGEFARGFERKLREVLSGGGFPTPIPDDLLRALVVWYYPIERMKEFRQSRRQSQAGTRFGRSFWPEPDEIRRRTVRFRGRHAELTTTRKFPRAVFGLPIVFQFKDELDPDQTTLQGARHDRLASPLILRPLACADGRFTSLATLLAAPMLPPEGLKLKGARDENGIDTADLTAEEANFRPLNGQPDVIRAFLATL